MQKPVYYGQGFRVDLCTSYDGEEVYYEIIWSDGKRAFHHSLEEAKKIGAKRHNEV